MHIYIYKTVFVETILSSCQLPRASCHVFQRCVRLSCMSVLSRIRLINTRGCGKDKRDASWIDSCVHVDKILSPYLALSLSAQNVSFQSLRCGSGCFCIVAVEQIVFCNRKRCGCFEDFLHCWNNQKYLVITIKVFLYVRCVF